MAELEAELEVLVGDDGWMALREVADALGTSVQGVRRLVEERQLLAVRGGSPRTDRVARVLVEPEPLVTLPGTLTVLADAGYSDAEALRWLLTQDEALGCSPLAALRAGRIAPVRRVAQVLAF